MKLFLSYIATTAVFASGQSQIAPIEGNVQEHQTAKSIDSAQVINAETEENLENSSSHTEDSVPSVFETAEVNAFAEKEIHYVVTERNAETPSADALSARPPATSASGASKGNGDGIAMGEKQTKFFDAPVFKKYRSGTIVPAEPNMPPTEKDYRVSAIQKQTTGSVNERHDNYASEITDPTEQSTNAAFDAEKTVVSEYVTHELVKLGVAMLQLAERSKTRLSSLVSLFLSPRADIPNLTDTLPENLQFLTHIHTPYMRSLVGKIIAHWLWGAELPPHTEDEALRSFKDRVDRFKDESDLMSELFGSKQESDSYSEPIALTDRFFEKANYQENMMRDFEIAETDIEHIEKIAVAYFALLQQKGYESSLLLRALFEPGAIAEDTEASQILNNFADLIDKASKVKPNFGASVYASWASEVPSVHEVTSKSQGDSGDLPELHGLIMGFNGNAESLREHLYFNANEELEGLASFENLGKLQTLEAWVNSAKWTSLPQYLIEMTKKMVAAETQSQEQQSGSSTDDDGNENDQDAISPESENSQSALVFPEKIPVTQHQENNEGDGNQSVLNINVFQSKKPSQRDETKPDSFLQQSGIHSSDKLAHINENSGYFTGAEVPSAKQIERNQRRKKTQLSSRLVDTEDSPGTRTKVETHSYNSEQFAVSEKDKEEEEEVRENGNDDGDSNADTKNKKLTPGIIAAIFAGGLALGGALSFGYLKYRSAH